MTIQPSNKTLLNWTGDTLAIGLFEDAVELKNDLAVLDEQLAGILKELIAEEEFTGKANSLISSRVGVGKSIKKVILVGLGKPDSLKLDSLRQFAATIARAAKKTKNKNSGDKFTVME
jgi:leucyl aminopeptidase